jgi:hypothetical protein
MAYYDRPTLVTALQDSSEAREQLLTRLKELEDLEIQGQQELAAYYAERERRELEFAKLQTEESARRIQALQEYKKQMDTHRHRLIESISKPLNF